MAADCKSAAPWSYGGSNPPLSTRIKDLVVVTVSKRFWIAMAIYAGLALLAWRTLTLVVDVSGRPVPLVWIVYALLLMFALRTWLHDKRVELESRRDSAKIES